MNFKEIFDKEIIVEDHIRKGLKVFYEIDLNLIKPKEEKQEQQPQPEPSTPPAEQPQQPQQQPVQEVPQPPQPEPTQPVEQPQQPQETQPVQDNKPDLSGLLASVQTEEDQASENSEEKVMRHFKGEYVCKKEQADNIQSFDDLINILCKIKKNGVNILDDFCKEITLLCSNQNFNEIKTKLDKKSKIFIEIYFGYKKDDSIGVRFRKSEGSDSLTSSILIDNQIVNTKFNIERVNQKIIEYRNYEVDKS